jgi:hypothetical protein
VPYRPFGAALGWAWWVTTCISGGLGLTVRRDRQGPLGNYFNGCPRLISDCRWTWNWNGRPLCPPVLDEDRRARERWARLSALSIDAEEAARAPAPGLEIRWMRTSTRPEPWSRRRRPSRGAVGQFQLVLRSCDGWSMPKSQAGSVAAGIIFRELSGTPLIIFGGRTLLTWGYVRHQGLEPRTR